MYFYIQNKIKPLLQKKKMCNDVSLFYKYEKLRKTESHV